MEATVEPYVVTQYLEVVAHGETTRQVWLPDVAVGVEWCDVWSEWSGVWCSRINYSQVCKTFTRLRKNS